MNRRSASALSICNLRTYLRVELLEARDVPSTVTSPLQSDDVQATVLEGRSTSTPLNPSGPLSLTGDSGIDPNTIESPFAGVGSILVTTSKSSFIGSAAAIGRRHVITAAHVVDLNNDGKANHRDKTTGTYFILNFGEDQSHRIPIEKVDIQPHFTGFNRPAINDDLAILTLAEDLPEGVPIYPIGNFDLFLGTTVTIVGYGRSGDGVNGYETNASLTVKRVGTNVIDAFYVQDDRKQPLVNEVFRFDYDGLSGTGPLGGAGVPGETQLGQGDSGGPSFVSTGNGLAIVGVNTFIQGAKAPKYGSMGGGVYLYSYRGFIDSILNPESTTEQSGGPPSISIPLLPVVGPISGLGVAVPKWVRVAAKAVSAEFAIESWTASNTPDGSAVRFGADAFNSTPKTEFSTGPLAFDSLTRVRSNESAALDPLMARLDISDAHTSLSLDEALVALVSGEALSVDS